MVKYERIAAKTGGLTGMNNSNKYLKMYFYVCEIPKDR